MSSIVKYECFLLISFILVCNLTVASFCASNKGKCVDVRNESCAGILYDGYCSGSSNILCCEDTTSCYNDEGLCINTSLQSCDDGFLVAGYCPGSDNIMCCVPLPDRCLGDGPALIESSYLYTLNNQGFDGHPGALVYVPSNFDKTSTTLDVVVYVHGFYNCIENIVRETNLACNCSENSNIRQAYNLINQFEAAALNISNSYQTNDRMSKTFTSDGTNWLLIAAEVAYDQASSAAGNWSISDMLRLYLDELLTDHLSKESIGFESYSVDSISRIRLFSHSGGYNVIADMQSIGGMTDKIMNMVLFDSLYGSIDKFESYVEKHVYACDTGLEYDQFRFDSIYTSSGGTYANNVAMATQVSSWIDDANDTCSYGDIMWYDNSYDTLTVSTMTNYGILFQLTNYAHDDIPRMMFQDFLIATA